MTKEIDVEAPPMPFEEEHDVTTLSTVRPVPRITIHAFCEYPDTASSIERAGQDRRLSKAHLAVRMGGVHGAIEQYQQSTTPNLIIVETGSTGGELFDDLASLAQVCDAGTKVIVIGHLNDVSVYREMIRQGVNEYLVTPLSPMQIMDAVSRLYADPDAPPIGRSIAFMGAKGGAGSSTLAHNIGWCISTAVKEDVIITDLDLPFGTAGLDFNHDPAQGIADALTAPERLDDVLLDRLLVKCSEHLSLFAAPAVLDREFDLTPESYESVLEVVRAAVPCVILDLPHVWSAWTKSMLLAADEIVITTTPDLAGLRNAKNIIDLAKASRANDRMPHLVINQVGIPKRPEIPLKDFARAIGMQPSLVIPFNPWLFGTAANNGQMIQDIEPSGKVTEGLRQLSRQLCGREAQVKQEPASSSFLRRLTGKKS